MQIVAEVGLTPIQNTNMKSIFGGSNQKFAPMYEYDWSVAQEHSIQVYMKKRKVIVTLMPMPSARDQTLSFEFSLQQMFNSKSLSNLFKIDNIEVNTMQITLGPDAEEVDLTLKDVTIRAGTNRKRGNAR